MCEAFQLDSGWRRPLHHELPVALPLPHDLLARPEPSVTARGFESESARGFESESARGLERARGLAGRRRFGGGPGTPRFPPLGAGSVGQDLRRPDRIRWMVLGQPAALTEMSAPDKGDIPEIEGGKRAKFIRFARRV